MTNEEKKAFWLIYGTQKVFRSHFDGLRYPYFGVHSDDGKFDCELRPLNFNELTDEECLCVSKIITKIEEGQTIENGRWYIKDVVMDYKHTYDLGDRCQRLIDYLRSIGVLVGFRNFTPEMLIAEGVVKIKE